MAGTQCRQDHPCGRQAVQGAARKRRLPAEVWLAWEAPVRNSLEALLLNLSSVPGALLGSCLLSHVGRLA